MSVSEGQGNYDVNEVLRNYAEKVQATQEQSKRYHPMLVLRDTPQGKQLQVAERNDLHFWEKWAAWFGMGNSALKNVVRYLNANQEAVGVENRAEVFHLVNRKIALRNSHSIQQVGWIGASPQALETIDVSAPYTFVPDPHSVDFARFFPSKNVMVIGDGTGHGHNAERAEKYHRLVDQEIAPRVGNLPDQYADHNEAIQQLKRIVMELANVMNKPEFSIGASLAIARLIEINGQKQIAFVSVGDCDLYLIREGDAGKEIHWMTPDANAQGVAYAYKNTDLNEAGTQEVANILMAQAWTIYPGDIILGVSDGVTDFMQQNPEGKQDIALVAPRLLEIFRKVGFHCERLSQALGKWIEEHGVRFTRNGEEQPFNPAEKTASDDRAVMTLTVL